jgi:alkylated DNA repair dioxygenase AlkB
MNFLNTDKINNLLPRDGEVNYHGVIMSEEEAGLYLRKLLTSIEWRQDEAIMFGKHLVTKRKAAWYGDSDYTYTYSKTTKRALSWTAELLDLKSMVQKISGATFNSCLLNLYHNGEEGMAYHSDDEKTLEKNGVIASLSFGAMRKFLFRHKKTKETTSVVLENGSLLVMKGATQANWFHRLPPAKKIVEPRVNLTFRTIVSCERQQHYNKWEKTGV